jgi:hypothetical protein
MRTTLLVLATALCSSACMVSSDTDGDSSLLIENESSFILDEVHVAPVESRSWGPNLVPEALFPGEAVEVILDCGNYDVLVVDETGVDCVLGDVDVCFSGAVWTVTDFTLDVCAFAPAAP